MKFSESRSYISLAFAKKFRKCMNKNSKTDAQQYVTAMEQAQATREGRDGILVQINLPLGK